MKRTGQFSGSDSVGVRHLLSNRKDDAYLAGWILNEGKESALIHEEQLAKSRLDRAPRQAILVSSVVHFIIFFFLFFEPLNLIGLSQKEKIERDEERRNALLTFAPTPAQVPPAVPSPSTQVAPEPPPSMSDSRIQLPKALQPPPVGERKFMNDLPFADGNTDEFYSDEEFKDTKAGDSRADDGTDELDESLEEVPVSMRENLIDASPAPPLEVEDRINSNNDIEIDHDKLKELLKYSFSLPNATKSSLPSHDEEESIESTSWKKVLETSEKRVQGGTFSDPYEIRRFLENTRFHNPDGGLVSNKGNTLYYNDKGANFVPWIMRLISEVKRNWLVPYSAAFEYGHVAVGVTVNRDGSLADLQIIFPSGTSGFDNAAFGALRASRLPPLPSDYPDERFDIILVFWYNERPYDIFG